MRLSGTLTSFLRMLPEASNIKFLSSLSMRYLVAARLPVASRRQVQGQPLSALLVKAQTKVSRRAFSSASEVADLDGLDFDGLDFDGLLSASVRSVGASSAPM